jgi:hypothetical protein
LEREARELFPNVVVARDGMEIDVPYSENVERRALSVERGA